MGGQRARTFVRAYNRDAMARLSAQLDGYSEEHLDRAAQRAASGARRKVQPIAKRDIAQRYSVKPSQLNNKFRVVQGRARGRNGDAYLGIWASDRQIGLIHFGGRWRKRSAGATAEIERGSRKTYRSAFIATVQGRKAIRARALKGTGTGKRHGRHPLVMLRGPSPFEMMLGRDMRNGSVIAGKVLDFYSTEIKRQIDVIRRKG